MRRPLLTTLLLLLPALWADAQGKITGPQAKQSSYQFDLTGFARREWTTRQYFDAPDDKRWQGRVFPRIEIGRHWFVVGAGGDFAYGSKDNFTDVPKTATLAENYRTQSARLDLAYLRLTPMRWLRIEGGRFQMPVPLTEMLWDGDLKPQGAAVSLILTPKGELARLSLTGLAARGSHTFDDEKTNMVLLSGSADIKGSATAKLALTASVLQYTDFNDLEGLDPRLFRQNTRSMAGLARAFRVLDLQARVVGEGATPGQLFFDYCVNTQADQANRGLWLGLTLGVLPQSRARWEYVYARIDRDATLGAYNTDDFLWHTDWEGHRGELAIGTSAATSFHIIGQLQRPRLVTQPDGTRPWVRRLRLEWRVHSSS